MPRRRYKVMAFGPIISFIIHGPSELNKIQVVNCRSRRMLMSNIAGDLGFRPPPPGLVRTPRQDVDSQTSLRYRIPCKDNLCQDRTARVLRGWLQIDRVQSGNMIEMSRLSRAVPKNHTQKHALSHQRILLRACSTSRTVALSWF